MLLQCTFSSKLKMVPMEETEFIGKAYMGFLGPHERKILKSST